ncbi:MAG: GAF domain-containing protein [Chloroflexota bacterium]
MSEPRETVILHALEAVAARAAASRRLEPPGGEAVLRSVVEATVTLFDAEAASIALHDPASDRLVIRVAAGTAGEGAVGLAFPSSEGIAGYVFTTGQPLAVSDVAADPRFDRGAAERTGYVPRSILAVPLLDDAGTIGVLEVLDRRGDGGFGLRDLDLASVFARQAAVAIRASRVERDVAELLRATLARLAADPEADRAALDAAVAGITLGLDGDEGGRLWALADAVARARDAAPDQVALVVEILDALARRGARPAARSFRR